MADKTIPIAGSGFTLPPDAQLIIVRAPADTDPAVFEGMTLSDLVEDDKELTKQMSIAFYKDEQSGFVQTFPKRSFALVERVSKDATSAPKVIRVEKPAMVPPTNLKVSPLPFQATSHAPKKSKKRKAAGVEDTQGLRPSTAPISSSKKKVKADK